MLKLICRIRDLDMTGLLNVDRETAERDYSSWHGAYNGMLDYLQSLFDCGGACGVWIHEGIYVSALRLEPYRDGLLLEALETMPDCRRQGYGKKLVLAALEAVWQENPLPVYSHVPKRNHPSLAIHNACGFSRISEQAVYIDGSVTDRSCTLRKEP